MTMTPTIARALTGHTPGPWRVRVNKRDSQDECDVSVCGDIFVLADLNGPQYSHQKPNADLISAAPDLLAGYIATTDENEWLRAENARLREALHFYADDHLCPSDGPWGIGSVDFGDIARAALKEEPKP